jgi:mannose-6-phosphate isomerase-like protein (cupin superfamily)
MLGLVFENIKVYGRYVKTNNLDGLEYWNRVKLFLQRPEQKVGLDELNKIIGSNWTINVKLSSNSNNLTSNLNEIYEFVHGDGTNKLNIFGEEGDEMAKSLKHDKWEQNNFFLQLIKIPLKNKLDLIKLLEIAYNLGQLSVCLEEKNFSTKAMEYFNMNNLTDVNSYIKLSPEQNTQIESNIQITDLITNTNAYVLEQMNMIQAGGGDIEPFYSANIEELTKTNTDYRRVLYTGLNQQFVLMSIPPKDTVKMEIHKFNDQFVRIEQGEGKVIIKNKTYNLQDNSSFIVPAGAPHQIINTSETIPLKLYTIYSPPEHSDKLTQKTNPDSNEVNVVIDTDSDNLVGDSEIKNQSKEIQNKYSAQDGGNIFHNEKIDYKKKYIEYKNRYITLKKFISKYN